MFKRFVFSLIYEPMLQEFVGFRGRNMLGEHSCWVGISLSGSLEEKAEPMCLFFLSIRLQNTNALRALCFGYL